MRPIVRLVLCLALAFGLGSAYADDDTGASPQRGGAGVINLSHDLVRLGIADRNLPSDSPTTDARPLFQAALRYIATHPTRVLTVDRGAYYFLTPQNSTAYLLFSALSDLTVDLKDSTVFFAGAYLQGFAVVNCQRVTLSHFRADFVTPPYTQVQLTAVNPAARTLAYTTLAGWPDPVTFNAVIAPGSSTTGPLVAWAMPFRDGDIVSGTSRMQVITPIAEGLLSLVQNTTPWTQPATLATLKPGDTIVVFVRGGQATVSVEGGGSITVADATIYGSSAQGILFNSSAHSIADGVRVVPPGNGLIATNAGGIISVNGTEDSHIRNSFVDRSLDDALAIYVTDRAIVAQQSGPRQLTVNRIAFARFPDGTKVSFVDPASGTELPGATIIGQVPPDSNAPVFGGAVTLTFDNDLPTLAPGFAMALADTEARGAGSTIEGNEVREVLFGRGAYVAGVEGATVANNEIGPTSDAGIGISQNNNNVAFAAAPTPPARDVVVRDNRVRGSLGPMASGAGSEIALGAIMVATTDGKNRFPSSSPNSNIVIEHNHISRSGRTGIWVGEVDGGAVRDNVIRGWNEHPELPLNGVDPQTRAELIQDFTQALVIHNSQNLDVRDNITKSDVNDDPDSDADEEFGRR